MTINIRTKGAEAEREVATVMNAIVTAACLRHGLSLPLKPLIQRNQNQSAVGGSDLTNSFDLAIEVKRQEALSINTWWKQCEVAARETAGIPILIYRQSRKPWRVVMLTEVRVSDTAVTSGIRAELSWEDFQQWFSNVVEDRIAKGWHPPK